MIPLTIGVPPPFPPRCQLAGDLGWSEPAGLPAVLALLRDPFPLLFTRNLPRKDV
jgi:hypothetical protein